MMFSMCYAKIVLSLTIYRTLGWRDEDLDLIVTFDVLKAKYSYVENRCDLTWVKLYEKAEYTKNA